MRAARFDEVFEDIFGSFRGCEFMGSSLCGAGVFRLDRRADSRLVLADDLSSYLGRRRPATGWSTVTA
jgi:hypothetical protein